MGKEKEIRAALKKLAGQVGPDGTLLGVVKEVNKEDNTCNLYDEETDLTFFDIRLRPVLDESKSLLIYPKVDSWALAIRMEDSDDWYLLTASEFESWSVKVEDTIIQVNEDGLLVKKNTDTLKDALIALIEGVEKIVVIQGTNPDYIKIAEAKLKINNLLTNATE